MLKTIVFGRYGFLAKSLYKYIKKNKILNYEFYSKKQIDLLNLKENSKLKKLTNNKVKVIFISCIAPAKNLNDVSKNLFMINNFFHSVNLNNISHFTYISSDAVYSDTKKIITEKSETVPNSYHGMMHLIRENLINNYIESKKLCILRPTLIYGKGDTHNGYGPNLFYKKVKNDESINIFGNGSEKRDHVLINDVIDSIYWINKKNSNGIFNLSSGEVITFKDIAKTIIKKLNSNSVIVKLKRRSPMPHLGYRFISNLKISKELNKKFLNFYKGINFFDSHD